MNFYHCQLAPDDLESSWIFFLNEKGQSELWAFTDSREKAEIIVNALNRID